MAMNAGTRKSLQAEPNVTPLIDVLLVLLIIFMVIVPVIPRGLTAMLPQTPKLGQPEPVAPIVVEVLARRAGVEYRINGQSVEEKAGLVSELDRIYSTRADKALFVRGDPGLSFEAVAEAIDASRAAGVDHVAILTPGMRSN
jgi:biopolymer transport protein TolR